MGTKHHAWTEGSLSAHLTVNVERQFVVWGALLTATACRLLLDARKCGSALQPFGMEGETRSRARCSRSPSRRRAAAAQQRRRAGPAAPRRARRRRADAARRVGRGRRRGARRRTAGGRRRRRRPRGRTRRGGASVSALLDELAAAPDAATRAALDWTDELLRRHLRASMPSHLERQRAGGAARGVRRGRSLVVARRWPWRRRRIRGDRTPVADTPRGPGVRRLLRLFIFLPWIRRPRSLCP